ncbi:salivary peroxidase/catechol oxidase-like isoform X1 [Mytilus galloprovincialis]|uniref:salivary peroxidase/catechol oxidase-like isoform X1 n=1 Tax=Mytilus galloprovincialis TaxID=29158 RepID=UPI003F7B976E
MSVTRKIGVVIVLLVIFYQSEGLSKHEGSLTKKEIETIEDIVDLLEEREKEKQLMKKEDATAVVETAFTKCLEKYESFLENQKEFKNKGVDGQRKQGKRNRLFKITPESIERQKLGFLSICAKRQLVKLTDLTLKELREDTEFTNAWDSITNQIIGGNKKRHSKIKGKRTTTSECQAISNVDQYRTLDGTCNNINNPDWGAAFSTQPRFLDEVYSNGVDEPRDSVVPNEELPGPRALSNAVFAATSADGETPLEGFNTLMSMNWGQFIDHDIVLTPTYSGDNGADIVCCTDNTAPIQRDECLAIIMEADDDLPITCMEFVRSAPAPDLSLSGNQLTNDISSFIDASMVYGSSEDELTALRARNGGKMKVRSEAGGDLLPKDRSSDAICSLDGNDPEDDYCQNAGDVRVNVQPGLGLLHTLFVREHNRIVDELAAAQPSWTDDELFNEARKIVNALIQHITYNEWLQNVFNDQTITEYNLQLLTSGNSLDYDDTINPGIRVGFATAALRFGHSMIPNKIAYMAEDLSTTSEETNMELTMTNPHMLVNEAGSKILDLVRYMTTIQASNADRQFSGSVRNKLFNTVLDLTSLNIQRGRDHGLPSYTEWRKACGLSVPSSGDAWSEMTYIRGGTRDLRDLYASVYDIDLYVGGMLEQRLTGDAAYVGETFGCILGEQFKNLKQGDRFWYERAEPEGFSQDKLQEIRKVTLASVFCKNIDNLTEIQRNALRQQTNRNDCSDERRNPHIDFNVWA